MSEMTEAPAKQLGRIYLCSCGRPVFFDNSACLACGTALGYDPEKGQLFPLIPGMSAGTWRAEGLDGKYKRCQNFFTAGCNWLTSVEDPNELCRACRLNRMIPNLESDTNRSLWARVEAAKRRLVSSLIALGLPVQSKVEDPAQGLAFDFLLSLPGAERPMTGHENGVITLNLEEADDATRERIRQEMCEPYRTLLGHLRHEVGHYYWDRLIENSAVEEFRALFGDERSNYDEALRAYYSSCAPADWRDRHVSAYATAHPWEDWAETWAHYLHMRDSVDVSDSFGLAISSVSLFEYFDAGSLELAAGDSRLVDSAQTFLKMVNRWTSISTLANELARSMGHSDFYPFILSRGTVKKLFFVHRVAEQVV